MNRKAVFVTATGTDIGKTYVSGLLVKKMRDLDFDCGYYKPALSGAIKQPDGSLQKKLKTKITVKVTLNN